MRGWTDPGSAGPKLRGFPAPATPAGEATEEGRIAVRNTAQAVDNSLRTGEEPDMARHDSTPAPRLEVILPLPTGVGFAADALGRSYPTRIAGRQVTLELPRFRWRDGQYVVAPPTLFAVRSDIQWDEYLHDPWAWGSVTAYRTGPRRKIRTAHVTHLLLTSTISAHARPGRVAEKTAALADANAGWWQTAKDWIEASTLQALDPPGGPPLALGDSGLAWAWDGSNGRRIVIPSVNNVTITRPAPMTGPSFEAVLRRCARREQVPAMHTLLRDARRALREDRPRLAVLDAATAAELAMNRLLELRLADSEPVVLGALRSNAKEMGRLHGLLGKLGVSMPNNLRSGLTDVRNRAIHGGAEPTIDEARTSLGLASKLVTSVSPHDRLLS